MQHGRNRLYLFLPFFSFFLFWLKWRICVAPATSNVWWLNVKQGCQVGREVWTNLATLISRVDNATGPGVCVPQRRRLNIAAAAAASVDPQRTVSRLLALLSRHIAPHSHRCVMGSAWPAVHRVDGAFFYVKRPLVRAQVWSGLASRWACRLHISPPNFARDLIFKDVTMAAEYGFNRGTKCKKMYISTSLLLFLPPSCGAEMFFRIITLSLKRHVLLDYRKDLDSKQCIDLLQCTLPTAAVFCRPSTATHFMTYWLLSYVYVSFNGNVQGETLKQGYLIPYHIRSNSFLQNRFTWSI